VAGRDWGRSTEVIHAYHMGCYASMPAIRMRRGLCGKGASPVWTSSHTELVRCIWIQASICPNNWWWQTLFADGLIRYFHFTGR